MHKKHSYRIVYEEGDIGKIILDEEETLKSMQIELTEETALEKEDTIKYEVIEFIRGKATDIIIFCKYRFLVTKIEIVPYIRLKGTFNFAIFSTDVVYKLLLALKKVKYRMEKINKINQCSNPTELLDFFNSIKADTLGDILSKQNVQNDLEESRQE